MTIYICQLSAQLNSAILTKQNIFYLFIHYSD